jgi:hypothetical protein
MAAENEPGARLTWADSVADGSQIFWVAAGVTVGALFGPVTRAIAQGDVGSLLPMLALVVAGLALLRFLVPKLARASQRRLCVTEHYLQCFHGDAMQWHIPLTELRDVQLVSPKKWLGVSLGYLQMQFYGRDKPMVAVPVSVAGDRSAKEFCRALKRRYGAPDG